MGFITQTRPDVDFPTWSQGSRAEKIRPMARQWAEVGFGTPVVLHLFYVGKILAYVFVGWAIVAATPGIASSNVARPGRSRDRTGRGVAEPAR